MDFVLKNNMNNDINKAVNNLVEVLRTYAPATATSFELFVNSDEAVIKLNTRMPEQLKLSGFSMRNLAGEFIK